MPALLAAGRDFGLGPKPAANPLSGTPAIHVDFSESCHWGRAKGPLVGIGSVGADGRRTSRKSI
jgi:hypothetical protein